MRRLTATAASVLAAGILMACSRKEPSPEATAAASAAAAPPKLPASATAKPLASAGPATSTGCPVGQWEYDYSDHFLENMANSTHGMKVIKESGKIVCNISGREKGTYTCKTTAEGVENVMEGKLAGTPMRIQIKIEGESKMDYESAGPNRWRTTHSNFDGLKVKAIAALGEKETPLPDFALFRGWKETGTIVEYKCKDGLLHLKPAATKLQAAWLHLKPLT